MNIIYTGYSSSVTPVQQMRPGIARCTVGDVLDRRGSLIVHTFIAYFVASNFVRINAWTKFACTFMCSV